MTLFEAVLAMVLVGATATAALSAAGGGVRAAERSRRAHEAAALAEERLAALGLLPAAALRTPPDSVLAGRFAPPFADYAWRTTIVPDRTLPALYRITVTITWDGGAWDVASALHRPPEDGAPSARAVRP